MFKARYCTKRSHRYVLFGSAIYIFTIHCCLIILLLCSCGNSVNDEKSIQLVESIISVTQQIKANYSNCLSNIEVGNKTTNLCKDEVVEIKLLHKKTKGKLLELAKLKNKGVLSSDVYNFYIKRINEELKGVRELSHQLKEKGISIDLR